MSVSSHRLENWAYCLELDGCGNISSLFDKRFSWEVFRQGNQGTSSSFLRIFPRTTTPGISPPITRKNPSMWILRPKLSLFFDGDRIGLRITREYQASVIVQTVYLYNTLERIDLRQKSIGTRSTIC